jgi:hypothetical protein
MKILAFKDNENQRFSSAQQNKLVGTQKTDKGFFRLKCEKRLK